MGEEMLTTRWINVKGRAKFLQKVDERMSCDDIKGEILTEAQRYAYAICEELDEFQKQLDVKLTTFVDKMEKR